MSPEIAWRTPPDLPSPQDEEHQAVADMRGIITRGRLRLRNMEWIVVPPHGAPVKLAECSRWRLAS